MEIIYKTGTPESFSKKEKEDFLQLLIKQNQVANPNTNKISNSSLLCIVYMNKTPIGIGAIKQVYDRPFDYAEASDFKKEYSNFELGYLYVDEDCKGLGIGKSISKFLLFELGEKKVFATTEISEKNPMIGILNSCGFRKIGKDYSGNNTGKTLGLFIR